MAKNKPAPAAGPLSAAPSRGAGKTISIRGAREHNLKNVDVDLPRDSNARPRRSEAWPGRSLRLI